MKTEEINELWPEDTALFQAMEGNWTSDNEREFFQQLHQRQLWDCSLEGDLLLHEYDNPDDLYIMRLWNEEYVVGCVKAKGHKQHTMNLSRALAINLKECGLAPYDMTLLEWLRAHDYAGIRYDKMGD